MAVFFAVPVAMLGKIEDQRWLDLLQHPYEIRNTGVRTHHHALHKGAEGVYHVSVRRSGGKPFAVGSEHLVIHQHKHRSIHHRAPSPPSPHAPINSIWEKSGMAILTKSGVRVKCRGSSIKTINAATREGRFILTVIPDQHRRGEDLCNAFCIRDGVISWSSISIACSPGPHMAGDRTAFQRQGQRHCCQRHATYLGRLAWRWGVEDR